MRLCVRPARGGSKRIIKKNIKSFHGRPIISYSIDNAIKCKLFDRVIVSTDNLLIAETAKEYGAEVPFLRPKKLSGDLTPTISVIKHAINYYRARKIYFEEVCCIYATAPLLQISDLKKSFRLFNTKKWDFVFSATEYNYTVFRSFKKLKSNGIKMLFPKFYNSRSQDLEKIYHDAGQFYWGKTEAWVKEKKFFSKNTTFLNLPNWRVVDIDTVDDWLKAEKIFETMDQNY